MRHPLTAQQHQVWMSQALEAGHGAYHVSLAWRLTGRLDLAALHEALRDVVHGNEALRTTFHNERGVLHARVSAAADVAPPRVVEVPESVAATAAELTARPFDLARDLLMRAWVLRDGDLTVLLLNWHHIAVDDWSTRLVERRLAGAYSARVAGAPPRQPPAPFSYADYARWQERQLADPALLRQETAFWGDYLRDAPEPMPLRTDHARPAVAGHAGAAIRFAVDAELTAALRAVAVRLRTTLYVVTSTVFHTMLGVLTGGDDHVVGTPFAGRTMPGTEHLVGLFVDLLAVRVRLGGADTWRRRVGAVRQAAMTAFDHHHVPFAWQVRAAAPPRSAAHPALVQVLFQVLEPPPGLSGPVTWAGLDTAHQAFPNVTARYDLELQLLAGAGGPRETLTGWLTYRTDLFLAGTAQRIADGFVAGLRSIAHDPESGWQW